MYGTVAHAKVKPGRLDDLVAVLDEWTGGTQPDGSVAGYCYSLDRDPNEIVMVVVFRDKASYLANADAPETDGHYRRFRELLEADPEWNDGEIVQHS